MTTWHIPNPGYFPWDNVDRVHNYPYNLGILPVALGFNLFIHELIVNASCFVVSNIFFVRVIDTKMICDWNDFSSLDSFHVQKETAIGTVHRMFQTALYSSKWFHLQTFTCFLATVTDYPTQLTAPSILIGLFSAIFFKIAKWCRIIHLEFMSNPVILPLAVCLIIFWLEMVLLSHFYKS